MTYHEIAEFSLGPTDIPEDALDMAATLLLDTLGVAAGAAGLQSGVLARDHAVRFHAAPNPRDRAHLLFDGRSASLPGVAFAIASQIDNLDAHDGYNPTKGHIGCAIVPALCAFGEAIPDLSARDALGAMVLAYEVATRAAITLHDTVSDYHTSGAWNGLGVAALGCRLRGLDSETLRHALGIAEYHGPRSQMMREIANPTMLHDGSGMGALTGMMAVLLAEQGFTGAPAITVQSPEVAPYWRDLGQDWTITKNYIKPYPICRWAHAALDALGMMLERHEIGPDDIATLDVHTFAESAQLFAGLPETTSQAQYSLPFALAVRLVHGHIAPRHICGEGLKDAAVAAQLPKIRVHEDPRLSAKFPQGRWSHIRICLQDGTELLSGDVHAKGGPEAPMPLHEVEAKFHVIAADLSRHRRNAIWNMRDRMLHPDTTFSTLLSLLLDPVDGSE